VQALTRVFWLCDGNQDGVLDDVELNKFQDTTGTPRGAEKVCGAWRACVVAEQRTNWRCGGGVRRCSISAAAASVSVWDQSLVQGGGV